MTWRKIIGFTYAATPNEKGPRRPRPIQCHPGIQTTSSANITMIVAATRAISANSRLRTAFPKQCTFVPALASRLHICL